MPDRPDPVSDGPFGFYEFFAGGGMARAGLGSDWCCLFANDFDHKKSRVYRDNYNKAPELKTGDVGDLTTKDLPGHADLVWASFPCQDLSLAGGGAGLKGERSGTFWPFWKLMKALAAEQRAPKVLVLENVCGTLTSHDGKDFVAICDALRQSSYRFGALVIDAALFVPQSRPRLFVLAMREDVEAPAGLLSEEPDDRWHTTALRRAHAKLPPQAQSQWIWWKLPKPKKLSSTLVDIIEDEPTGVEWHTRDQTRAIVRMMSDINLKKLSDAKKAGRRMVGFVYKRTRKDELNGKIQRAEVRFDGVSGCLRTPGGGSSRQTILVVEGEKVRSRLISTRETARLMGLPERYKLPENYNEAYHLTGDGVVVPVVRHIARYLIEPILERPPLLQAAE
ncbi:DNA cytosine methyltransferase [Leptospira interrogans]